MSKSLEDILKARFSRFDGFDILRWLTGGHKTINHAEQMSLLSLITYVAVEKESSVDLVQDEFLKRYNLERFENLRSDDYDDAVHFLMHWDETIIQNVEKKSAR